MPRSKLHRPSSWVVTHRQTGQPVLETFQRSVAAKVNRKKYRVTSTIRHLQRLNQV